MALVKTLTGETRNQKRFGGVRERILRGDEVGFVLFLERISTLFSLLNAEERETLSLLEFFWNWFVSGLLNWREKQKGKLGLSLFGKMNVMRRLKSIASGRSSISDPVSFSPSV